MAEALRPNDSTQQEAVFELEGPAYLERDQNFFNQPPFASVLSEVSLSNGVSIQTTRVVLLQLANRLRYVPLDIGEEMSKFNHPNPKVRQLAIDRIFTELHLGAITRSLGEQNPDKAQYALTAGLIETGLEVYPYWSEYIRTQQVTSTYGTDGAFTPHGSIATHYENAPTQSYVYWAGIQLKGERSERLYGIEDIFPGDFRQDLPRLHTSARRIKLHLRRIKEAELRKR